MCDRIQTVRSSHHTVGRGASVKKRWADCASRYLGCSLEQLRQAPAGLADERQDARGMDGDVEADMGRTVTASSRVRVRPWRIRATSTALS